MSGMRFPCSSQREIKIHQAKAHKPAPTQEFKGRLADRIVKLNKVMKQQTVRLKVKCNDTDLDNVFSFKYLGTIFTADTSHIHDVKSRITITMTRCGKLTKS